MIVADTSAWIDYFNGVDAPHVEILDYELLHNRIIIGDLIIAELLQGFREDKHYKTARKLIDNLDYRDFGGREIAYKAAENFRKLRKKGITIRKTIDMLIGTFCIQNDFELIHNDKDFEALEKYLGLKIRKEIR
jgi:predicted nucleic acid-binding protein